MDDENTPHAPLALSELPAVGQALHGGTFAGIATVEGRHVAVVLLPDRVTGPGVGWKRAVAWAKALHAALPSAQVGALLTHANLPLPRVCWLDQATDSMRALNIDFGTGETKAVGLTADYSAVAVRLLPLAGNADQDDLERRVAAVEVRVVLESLPRRLAALEALLPAAS